MGFDGFMGLWFLGGWIDDGCCWCLFVETVASSVKVVVGVCLMK